MAIRSLSRLGHELINSASDPPLVSSVQVTGGFGFKAGHKGHIGHKG